MAAAPMRKCASAFVVIVLAGVFSLGKYSAEAAVPYDLSNLHSRSSCPREVLVVRPRTIEDVQEMFCSGQSSYYSLSANILTTTIRPLRIQVDEEDRTVTVSAGVILIDLLDYLADYITPVSPAGWTLGAFPWYVYQVEALHVVLANGTATWITPESHPQLMKAFRVSVGRLGVIVEVKLRIRPEVPVKRTNVWMRPSSFIARMMEVQDQYTANQTMPDWVDEIQFFWSAQTQEVAQVTFDRADEGSEEARKSILSSVEPDESTMELLWAITSEILDLQRERSRPLMPSNVEQPRLVEDVSSADNGSASAKRQNVDESAADYLTYLQPNSAEATAEAQSADMDSGSHSGAAELDRRVMVNGGSGRAVAQSPVLEQDASLRIDSAMLEDVLARIDTTLFARAGKLGDLKQAINALELPPEIMNTLGPLATTWQPSEAVARREWITSMGASYLYAASVVGGLESTVGNATFEAASSYIHQPLESNEAIETTLYSQYEVAIPVSTVGRCFKGILQSIYGENVDAPFNWTGVDTGFRTANLIRIIGKEDGLLSLTNDEPRVYMNFEDYVGPNMEPGTGYNEGFQAVVTFLRGSEECKGTRMHWGKAGMPEPGCFDGAREFPDTWCHFGCAVHELDPGNKFTDTSDAWNWQGVDLDACCTPDGFDYGRDGCQCQPIPVRDDCPPSPFYDMNSSYMYWK
eukprot:jgi/Tetstr1/432439/TSEL_021815.t1